MFIRLSFIFILVPAMELYILFRVHELIGLGATIGLILLTGGCGAWLARTQGLYVISRTQQALSRGEIPADELLDGAMVLAGGLLLLTPGFCTDLLGFVLLTPVTRPWLKKLLRQYLQKLRAEGRLQVRRYGP